MTRHDETRARAARSSAPAKSVSAGKVFVDAAPRADTMFVQQLHELFTSLWDLSAK